MYTLCVTEKTAAQQRTFEQALLQMLTEVNYDDVTVSDLCRRAGLSRKTFYRLFERKSDVLYALIDQTLMDASSFVPDESVGPSELHRFFAYWKEQKVLLDVLQKHHNSTLLTDRAIRHILHEDSAYMHCFGADMGKFGGEIMVYYISGIFALVLAWHARNYDHSIDEMSQLLLDLLSNAAIKNPIFL